MAGSAHPQENGRNVRSVREQMTYRYYLQDMAFACALDVPEVYVDEIIVGLQNPVWPICLGRKSCVPTDIVYRGRFDSQEEALTAAGEIAKAKRRAERFRVAHGRVEGGDVLTLNDIPIAFGLRKRYEDRQVTILEQ
ncbi:MAG: type I-E CRISPR-associated protein Cas5/CasD [Bilophila wadsworthia]